MHSSRKLSVLWFVSLFCLSLAFAPASSADDEKKPGDKQESAPAEKAAEVKEAAKSEKPAQKDEDKKPEAKKEEKKPEAKKPEPKKADKKADKAEMKEEKKEDKKPEEKPVVKSVFPDKALESAVRAEVFAKRHNDEPITAEDVAKISRVVGTGKGIQSLEGLQHCKSLMLIDLADNKIEDLSPIAD